MPTAINPMLEDEPITTIYFQDEDFTPDQETYIAPLAKHINRDIGVGVGFINLYTHDEKIVQSAISWLEAQGINIDEVAE